MSQFACFGQRTEKQSVPDMLNKAINPDRLFANLEFKFDP